MTILSFNTNKRGKSKMFILFLFPFFSFTQQPKCGLTYHSARIDNYDNYSIVGTQFVARCLEKLGQKNIKIDVYTNNDINNCYAHYIFNRPTITLDDNWLKSLRPQDDWFKIWVIGHEIGHLILRHLEFPNRNPHINELEADKIGAYLIQQFNYPYNDISPIIPKDFSNEYSYSHPHRKERIKASNEILNQTKFEKNITQILGWFKVDIHTLNKTEEQKLKELVELSNKFQENENKETFLEIYTLIQSLSKETINQIKIVDLISFLESGTRLGIINEMQFCEEILKLYKKTLNQQLLLSIGPYYNNLDKKTKTEIKNVTNIINLQNSIHSKYDAFHHAMLAIQLGFEKEISKEIVDEIVLIKLPDFLKDDTNSFDFFSIKQIYYNAKGDYLQALFYAEKESSIISQLLNRKEDNYLRFQFAKSIYNHALIAFRLGEFNLSLILLDKCNNEFKSCEQYYKIDASLTNEIYYLKARNYLELHEFELSEKEIIHYHSNGDAYENYIIGLIYWKNNKQSESKLYFQKSCQIGYYKSCELLKKIQ